jgi:hypothetical protein
MRALLFSAIGLLMITQASAMDITTGTPMPIEIDADLTFEENGRQVTIKAPWARQSLNIMNDNPNFQLVVKEISATSSCLEDAYGYGIEIHASFDHENMNVQIPVGGSSYDTGDMYFYDLTTDCKKGHLVRVDVEGELVDSSGNYVDDEYASTAFITRR